MISICIPVYNFDVSALVADLNFQAAAIALQIEIILIDDASERGFREINNQPGTNARYIQLDQNVGRARIRNLFLHHAQYPYLLFLDCDGSIRYNPGFLQKYLRVIDGSASIVCGGRIYPEKCPSGSQSLSWKYGKAVESKAAAERNLQPARSFMTNNFLIKKEILAASPFEETIRHYGHEDTLFGIALEKKGHRITHMDNPVLNLQIETNQLFLEKTGTAVANLVYLVTTGKLAPADKNKVRLLNSYERLEKAGFSKLWNYCFRKLKTTITRNLLSENPRIFFFSLYKLGVLGEMMLNSKVKK